MREHNDTGGALTELLAQLARARGEEVRVVKRGSEAEPMTEEEIAEFRAAQET